LYANFSSNTSKVDEVTTVYVKFNLGQDVPKMIAHFTLAVPRDKYDDSFDNVILKTAANICKMGQGMLGEFISKMIMERIHESSDFRVECPFVKRTYRMTNFTLSDRNLPTHLISENLRFALTAKIMGKIASMKNIVHLFTVKINGEIKK